MKGCHWQRRRFSLQTLCVVQSPTSEEESSASAVNHLPSVGKSGKGPAIQTVKSSTIQEPEVGRQSRNRFLQPPPSSGSSNTKSAPPTKSHYKVVVLGSARAGKTSLVGQFWYAAFSPRYRPTVDDMHAVELDIGNGINLRLDILDTGGSYAFPAMRSLAIQGADGFILVCAADDADSLQEVEQARSQIFEIKGKSAPIVVVVNKIDLIPSSSEPRVQHQPSTTMADKTAPSYFLDQHKPFLCLEMVESLVTCDWGHGFVAASAKDNVNVTQVFQELFIQAKSRIALSPAVRKRRQSLPARVLLPNQMPPLANLHSFSLRESSSKSIQATAQGVHPTTPIKRNSCTVS